MKLPPNQSKRSLTCVFLLGLLLTGLSACSSVDKAVNKVKNIDLWPFDDGDQSSSQVRTYRPANSTEYLCDKSQRFFTRQLDKGETIWLITKEREISLPKVGAGEYRLDDILLSLGKDSASLTMSANAVYTNCKVVPIK